MVPNHSRPLGHQAGHHHHKHHHKKKGGGGGGHHKHRNGASNSNHHNLKTPKVIRGAKESEDSIDSANASNIALCDMTSSGSASPLPDGDNTSIRSDTNSREITALGEEKLQQDDDEGIVMHFSHKRKHKSRGERSQLVPSLPSADYAADSPKLSRHTITGTRNDLAAREAKKWRSNTIVSEDGFEVVVNKDAINDARKDDTVIDVVPDIKVTSDTSDDDSNKSETKF